MLARLVALGVLATTLGYAGPLRVSSVNPRYFVDSTGRAVLLAGSHTWHSVFEQGPTDPPPHFNITQFLNFLQSYGHNFTRTFVWEQARRGTWTSDTNYWFYPGPPWKRTGPGNASDGKPKFNLDSLNQPYFDWIKTRVDSFYSRGIYVSIQLFDGWSVSSRGLWGNPWLDHPMRLSNNVNGINGDPDNNGDGTETQSLSIPQVWPIQLRYIKRLIDELNAYDNILWEVSNESSYDGSEVWEQRIIDTIKAYELTKPKQHPIGFTADWYAPLLNSIVFASNADWISPGAGSNGDIWKESPPDSGGRKVVLNDTDHLWGNGGDAVWVWKSFLRGTNVLYMDGYDGAAYGTGHPWTRADSANPAVIKLRKNLGYILLYAKRMNLLEMTPRNSLSSTSYCLANPATSNPEYLVFQPSATGSITVDLSAVSGTLNVEWFDPNTGDTTNGGTVLGGVPRSFTSPFNNEAVLYVHGQQAAPFPPILSLPPNGSFMQSDAPTLIWHRSASATSYRLQLSIDSSFTSVVLDDSAIIDTSRVTIPLLYNTRYFWHVSATNNGGTSPFSQVFHFTTTIAPPTLIVPLNGETNLPLAVILRWNQSSGAIGYRLQLSADSLFASTTVDDSILVDTLREVGPLEHLTTYFWRVLARGAPGPSNWSAVRRFSTLPTLPEAPELLSPPDASANQLTTLLLVWHPPYSASTYHLQLSTDSLFSSTVVDDSTWSDTTYLAASLPASSTYYWRVAAINIAGTSPWSSRWTFSTAQEVSQLFPTARGWNLLSLPLTVFDNRKVFLFPTSTSDAFAFSRGIGYVPSDTLGNRIGYWLKFDSAQDVNISGIPHAQDTIDLGPGWNLIGSVFGSIDTAAVFTVPPGIQLSHFFEYASGYRISPTIDGGKGYWVKAEAAARIVLSSRPNPTTDLTQPVRGKTDSHP